MKSKREQIREQRRRRRAMIRIGWIALAAVVVAGVAFFAWSAARPAAGQSVPVMSDTTHVEEGTDPGPYNSDPPTSGRHYETDLEPGFYETNEYEYPEGYLVHNLEHGYIIFWFDCEEVVTRSCEDLKAEIRSVMEAENFNKVIAYPWDTEGEPVVLTSWGQMLRMDEFDPEAALDFVRQNRNKAPEPMAD